MPPESEGVFIDTNVLIYSTFDDFERDKHVQCKKLSLPRRRESRTSRNNWIPASAGMTKKREIRLFTRPSNFKRDQDEVSTTTALDGTFTLPVTPSYDYVTVSTGGIDTLTNLPAHQMLAPAGINIVSTATTAVVLEPAMAQKFIDLGINYTADITQAVTPAALLLIESIQAATDSLTLTLSRGCTGLTLVQMNVLQQRAKTQIMAQVKNLTVAQITTPATLTAVLQTAVKDTLDTVAADPAMFGLLGVGAITTISLANAIVSPALISSVITAIGTPIDVLAGAKFPEITLIDPAEANVIVAAINTAAANAAAQITCTP